MTRTWTDLLVDQLDFYLAAHLWPRLDGLTDEEYLWEPVAGCWSVRTDGRGGWRVDDGPAEVEPVTTIAWRLAHLSVTNFGARARCFFGPQRIAGADMFDPRYEPTVPGTADAAVALLEATCTQWRNGVAALDDDRLAAPVGPGGGPYAGDPFAALVLHVNRETMHHGGEVALLRDLYRDRDTLRSP